MNSRLRLALPIAFLLLLCCSDAYAQRPVLGGYREVSTEDSLVAQAVGAALLQKEVGDTAVMLVAVERAERQVVAGTNFKLCLRVRITDKAQEIEVVRLVQAVVYRSLQGDYTLSSWKEEECVATESGSTDDSGATESTSTESSEE